MCKWHKAYKSNNPSHEKHMSLFTTLKKYWLLKGCMHQFLPTNITEAGKTSSDSLNTHSNQVYRNLKNLRNWFLFFFHFAHKRTKNTWEDEPCSQGNRSGLSELSTHTRECYSHISHSLPLLVTYICSRILKKLQNNG